MPPEILSRKFSRLDLTMKFGGKLVYIEIQVKNDQAFRDRTHSYLAKLYISALKSGEEYGEIKQTITINIINFNMFDSEDFRTQRSIRSVSVCQI